MVFRSSRCTLTARKQDGYPASPRDSHRPAKVVRRAELLSDMLYGKMMLFIQNLADFVADEPIFVDANICC